MFQLQQHVCAVNHSTPGAVLFTTYLGAAPQKVRRARTLPAPAAADALTDTLTGVFTTGAGVSSCRATVGAVAEGAVMDASTSDTVEPPAARVSKATAPGRTHKPCTVAAMLLPAGLPRVMASRLPAEPDTHPAASTVTPDACISRMLQWADLSGCLH